MNITPNLSTLMPNMGGLQSLGLKPQDAASEASGTGGLLQSFGQTLGHEMNKLNVLQQDADLKVQTYATGGEIDLHTVILGVDKADMAMQLAVQVRNRMVSAYQEVSRMQI